MSDRRQLLERLFEVVQDRIDEAEKIGLQKLDEAERLGRREFAKASERHKQKLEKLERTRKRDEKRNKRRRRSRDTASDLGRDIASFFELPTPPTPPTPEAPPVPPVPPVHEERPSRLRGSRHGQRRQNKGRKRGKKVEQDRAEKSTKTRKPLTPEERAYRQARKRANLRLAFYTHAAVYGSVIMLLIVTTRSFRAVSIVAMSWGIGLFLHYFWTLSAPRLRERWIQREVGERAPQDVSRDRQKAEGRHVQSMEDLSASIAHEIRNPITAAKSLVQQMGEDPMAHDNIEFADVALQELDRVERSISHLLRYAREEELRFGAIEMADIVESAIETFRDRLQRGSVDLQLQLDTRGAMRGDGDKLRRVIINLVSNALDAFEEDHTPLPVLSVMSGDNLAGDEVWVRVSDNGPGIDGETLSKVWSPFYTTKESGTGLGLALSRKLVDAHGGTMEVESTPKQGTEFILTFPKDAHPRERDRDHGEGA